MSQTIESLVDGTPTGALVAPWRFSPSGGCFYPPTIHYAPETLPDDLIESTEDEFHAAMSRSPEQDLAVINGRVVVVERAPTQVETVVPGAVTPYQASVALLNAGLLDEVESAIDALVEPERSRARLAWTRAQTIERQSEFVQLLAGKMNWGAAQLDALFTAASKVN